MEYEQYALGKRVIQDDPDHYLYVSLRSIKFIRVKDEEVVNEWTLKLENFCDCALACLDPRGRTVRPWVDCRLGKLLIVQWSTSPPRMYEVWDLFTKRLITEVNLYYLFPRDVPVRAWITRDGVAVTSGPKYDHGVSWSYIPFVHTALWINPVQSFLGCWVTYMVVDNSGEIVAVYDYEDDYVYVYDLTRTPIKGYMRGRSVYYPKTIKRVDQTTVEMEMVSRHDDSRETLKVLMKLE